jgi:hypothetical protein
MEQLKNYVLSDSEWRIIARLREVPESPVRGLLFEFLDQLTDFVREPRCPEVQADGVPCGAVSTDCIECLAVKQMLETLRNSVQKP